MKVKPDAFDIGKLIFSFGEFDNSKKLVNSIDFYLDMKNSATGKNGHVLCQDILSGKIIKLMDAEEKIRLGKLLKDMTEQEKAAIQNDKKYAQAVKTYQGGQSSEKANREDGKALAKVMKISRGSRQPIIISCESGPGAQTEQGLIVPQWKGKAETTIRVSMTNDDLKTLALAIQTAYQAWMSAKFSVKLFADERRRREKN